MAKDMFLQIATIPGESSDAGHDGWIEINGFNHQVFQPGLGSRSSGGAAATERCTHNNFVVVKDLDKASPKLAEACSKGSDIGDVTLELCRATGDKQKYMEYKLTNGVIVASYRPHSGGEGGLATEEVAFNYGKIEWTYTDTEHTSGAGGGNTGGSWNLINNSTS